MADKQPMYGQPCNCGGPKSKVTGVCKEHNTLVYYLRHIGRSEPEIKEAVDRIDIKAEQTSGYQNDRV